VGRGGSEQSSLTGGSSETAREFDERRSRPSGPLSVRARYRSRAVLGLLLHVQQTTQLLAGLPVDLSQQGDGGSVVLSLRVNAEPFAAGDVRGGDAGVDAQGHVGVADVGILLLARTSAMVSAACRNCSALRIRPCRVADVPVI